MEWQPMETAPKDGTVIGVWSAREPGIVRRAAWGRFGKSQHYGWITATKGCYLSNVPTHWMPLPAPPEAA
jgi:hypothetical protein